MEGELRLDPWPSEGSTFTRKRSIRVTIPTDRYDSAEFKIPAPKFRRGARSFAPTLKSQKSVIKEGWAQRPETIAPRGKIVYQERALGSTRTRAASLEKLQTGSIKV